MVYTVHYTPKLNKQEVFPDLGDLVEDFHRHEEAGLLLLDAAQLRHGPELFAPTLLGHVGPGKTEKPDSPDPANELGQ